MTRDDSRTNSAPVQQRALAYRRDFQTIYTISLALCLLAMPLMRAAGVGRGRRGRRPSMLAQARTDAGIVASYALMGF